MPMPDGSRSPGSRGRSFGCRSASRIPAGFTLLETVVTVGLLAVLAAFIVPTVMRKSDTADPVKIANDLGAISAAIQTFGSDVKTTFPGDLQDLTMPLRVNQSCAPAQPCDSTVTHANVFTLGQAQQWRGPYLTISTSDDPAGVVRTGFTGEINNTLLRFDTMKGVPEFCTPAGVSTICPGFDPADQLSVAVKITGLTLPQLKQVNELIDGSKERYPALEGRFRYATDSVAYFLAAPIPPESTEQ